MAEIKIRGDVSGSTTIKAPDSGSDEIIELSSALASKLAYPTGGADGEALIKDGTSAVWGAIAGGKILQVVRATDGTARSTTSTSFVDASISVTITPQKNTSAVLLIWSFFADCGATNSTYAEYRITDASNNPISGAERQQYGGATVAGGSPDSITLIGYATPATTFATTYKGQFRTNQLTAFLVNDLLTGQLFAIEVAA
jgi:hypothetical protein